MSLTSIGIILAQGTNHGPFGKLLIPNGPWSSIPAPATGSQAGGHRGPRLELPPLIGANTQAMFSLLRGGSLTGQPPWARLYAEARPDHGGEPMFGDEFADHRDISVPADCTSRCCGASWDGGRKTGRPTCAPS